MFANSLKDVPGRAHRWSGGPSAGHIGAHVGATPLAARLCERSRGRFTGPVRVLADSEAGVEAHSATADTHNSPGSKSHGWPRKSSLYLFRTDGKSCSRELVTGNSKLRFAHPSTQQHLLVWRDRPRSVMIIKKLGRELQEEFQAVLAYLAQVERLHVVVEPHMYQECASRGVDMTNVYTYTPAEASRLADFVDFVCCLGGDGVILHASMLFRSSIPPVLSFHLGSMGFLTNHLYNDYKKALREVIYGSTQLDTCSMDQQDLPLESNHLGVMVTLRMRLECTIIRRGQDTPEQKYEVLNEVVLDRGSNSFLTNIECYISGRLITRVQADGIMLATPTGSTAYSVAAGGSMVHPNVPAILFTPICPHSLNFRPIVLPDYVELELRVPEEARVNAWVCFDGKRRQELHRGDRVFVKMSENPVPTINKTDLTGDWFESLERCFRWSNRSEQKPLTTPPPPPPSAVVSAPVSEVTPPWLAAPTVTGGRTNASPWSPPPAAAADDSAQDRAEPAAAANGTSARSSSSSSSSLQEEVHVAAAAAMAASSVVEESAMWTGGAAAAAAAAWQRASSASSASVETMEGDAMSSSSSSSSMSSSSVLSAGSSSSSSSSSHDGSDMGATGGGHSNGALAGNTGGESEVHQAQSVQ